MAVPTINTFEHDISDEIKQKEATITDIALASGEIKNDSNKKLSIPVIVGIVIIFLSIVIGGGLYGYLYYEKKARESLKPLSTPLGPSIPTIPLSNLSKTMDENIGRFIKNVQHSDYGYSMTITNYSSVYAYMLKNESDYADEIAKALGEERDVNDKTNPFIFTDITLSNQNMRIATSASSTIVYSFVDNMQTLLISSSADGILSLHNAILQ